MTCDMEMEGRSDAVVAIGEGGSGSEMGDEVPTCRRHMKRTWNVRQKMEHVEEKRGRVPTSDTERMSWPMFFDTMLGVEPEHVCGCPLAEATFSTNDVAWAETCAKSRTACEACVQLVAMCEEANTRGERIQEKYFRTQAGMEELQRWPNYKMEHVTVGDIRSEGMGPAEGQMGMPY